MTRKRAYDSLYKCISSMFFLDNAARPIFFSIIKCRLVVAMTLSYFFSKKKKKLLKKHDKFIIIVIIWPINYDGLVCKHCYFPDRRKVVAVKRVNSMEIHVNIWVLFEDYIDQRSSNRTGQIEFPSEHGSGPIVPIQLGNKRSSDWIDLNFSFAVFKKRLQFGLRVLLFCVHIKLYLMVKYEWWL